MARKLRFICAARHESVRADTTRKRELLLSCLIESEAAVEVQNLGRHQTRTFDYFDYMESAPRASMPAISSALSLIEPKRTALQVLR